MKSTTTKHFAVLFTAVLFLVKFSTAQTACNYVFTKTLTGTSVKMDNTPNVSFPATIIWTYDTVQFSTSNDPTYNGVTPGFHVICMTVIDITCVNNPTTIKCDTLIVGPLGISDVELSKSIKMYPNPSSGKINLESTLEKVENIQIYNALGALVFQEKETYFKNELDLNFLPGGMYIVKTKTASGVVTKKLTINK